MSPIVQENRSGFDLGDYVEVKDRLRTLFELFAQARVTTTYELTREPDDKPKVIARAMVYRTPDDPVPASGTSWMYLPGKTSYTRDSEIENAETSAVGRAIGMMGILIDRSIASANEIEGKRGAPPVAKPPEPPDGDGSLIGTVEVGAKQSSDFELRMTPDGHQLGFRLKGDRGGILVEVSDPLASALALIRDDVVGKRVTCWGVVEDREFETGQGDKKHTVKYQALRLERIKTPTVVLPAQAREERPETADEPEVDAESEAVLDEASEAELDGIL